MKRFVFGTRGSDLALAQTRMAASRLRAAHPGLEVGERIIRTTGDARLDVSLSAPGALDKGLFTKELEEALLRGEIDAAVHSLKDLPVEQPPGLCLGAILPREEPGDVLAARAPGGLAALPQGATVATSSLRRKCFLRWRRPDLVIRDIRGNVPTRLRKLADDAELDAIVLAAAGLRRLAAAGVALPALELSPLDFMLPAPGQGAIAIECRAEDSDTLRLLRPLHDEDSAACVRAERAVLAGLGGGCHMPLGARARISGGQLDLQAAWFRAEATQPRTADATAPAAHWQAAADAAVTRLLA